jgi:xylulokinase
MVFSDTFEYDTVFPEYETIGGILPSALPEERHTSPLMLLEAMDHCFKRLSGNMDLSRAGVIKVDAMQHCSVYVKSGFQDSLRALNHGYSLVNQLAGCFSRSTCPTWEDRSTADEAGYLANALEQMGGVSRLTGNRAELRFPAAQILRWARMKPAEYDQTDRVFLLSAFMTSILAGKDVPVDTGDGWGTNLNTLDINNPGWHPHVVDIIDARIAASGTATPLLKKLGGMNHYDAPAGRISSYFVEKYGMNSKTEVLTGTGDNPATLLGCGGGITVSLGSSYTLNGVMQNIEPSSMDEYNIFGYTRGQAMALSVITNGAKVHDNFMRTYLQVPENKKAGAGDWALYTSHVGDQVLKADEPLLLPYLMDESVPLKKKGIHRDRLHHDDAEGNIRALHLSQVISMKCHSSHLGVVDQICIVGGGARNQLMRQWIADAFNAVTYSITHADLAAPMGCAVSGAAHVLKLSYEEAIQRFVKKDETTICRPEKQNNAIINQLQHRYLLLENYVVSG